MDNIEKRIIDLGIVNQKQRVKGGRLEKLFDPKIVDQASQRLLNLKLAHMKRDGGTVELSLRDDKIIGRDEARQWLYENYRPEIERVREIIKKEGKKASAKTAFTRAVASKLNLKRRELQEKKYLRFE